MFPETNLQKLLQSLQPEQNPGEFVFCQVKDLQQIEWAEVLMFFQEKEAVTLILKKETADRLSLSYPAIMSWITLTVYSSLTAVGLTAAFSNALAAKGISCNVVAAFNHDHIFVTQKDTERAMEALIQLSLNS